MDFGMAGDKRPLEEVDEGSAKKSKQECYQCGGVGHFSKQCPSAPGSAATDGKPCHGCNGKGHFIGQCPNKQKNEEGTWQCLSCSNVNWAKRTACNRCQVPRPAGTVIGTTPIAPITAAKPQTDWVCKCGFNNKPFRGMCMKCERPKEADLEVEWICTKCTNVNWASRVQCNKCEATKPLYLQELQQGAVTAPARPAPAASPYAAAAAAAAAAAMYQMPPFLPQQASMAFGGYGAPAGSMSYPGMSEVPRYDGYDVSGYPQAAYAAMAAAAAPQAVAAPVTGAPAGQKGEWLCSCGNTNFAFRAKCNRCDAQRPQATASDQDWICTCGNVSWASRQECIKCHAPKPEYLKSLPPSRPGGAAYGVQYGGAPAGGGAPKKNDWTCSCGNVNWQFRTACNRCKLPKQS